jgi:fumarate reductase flavoprotein subunit
MKTLVTKRILSATDLIGRSANLRGGNMKENVSRRTFLASMGAAGIAVGANLMGCGSEKDSPLSQSTSESEQLDALTSVQEAMTAEQYKGKWSFEIPPEPIGDDAIVETIETDVVVLGAGTSGLVVANSLLDAGIEVCVVTASSIPIFRGGSNHAVMSKAKKRLGLEADDPTLFDREIIGNGVLVDQKKWYRFYNHSEEAMDWLIGIMEDKGYETSIENGPQLLDEGNYYSLKGAHGFMTAEAHTTGMNQKFVVDELASRLEDGGMKIYYKTIGRQLVRGGEPNGTSGRVEAVVAEREDGTFAKFVGSKAVVLATGDFSTNRDMMYKYAPNTACIISDEVFDAPTDYDRCFEYGGLYPGDGHQMGLWVGAAWQRIWPCCPMGGAVSVGPANRTFSFGGLKVNRFGRRFSNEYGLRDMTGYTNRMETNGEVYALWNEDYAWKLPSPWVDGSVPYGEDNEIPTESVIENWQESVESGDFVKADTIAEVIQALGLPAETNDTVARYNELCAKGSDDDFHKDPSLMISLENGPFYGAKSAPAPFLSIMGGLRTNEEMAVCNESDEPIPGLYNVGTMVGDMYAVNYTFQIPGLNLGATCVTFGYMLGKYIASNE